MTKATKAVAAMQRSKLPLLIGGALLLYALYASQQPPPTVTPDATPAPKVQPKKPAAPKPPSRPCPSCPQILEAAGQAAQSGRPELGGVVSPDGLTHSVLWMDSIDWPHNIASRGLGCCGFRSLEYCARLQGVDALIDWPEQMRKDGIAGGAYPQKVDSLLERYAQGISYWQDCSKSHALLSASVQSQRGVAVDYCGHDPHYPGRIAHCVTLVAFDETNDWVAILDNNYPALDQIVWMSVKEFDQRWGGWAYGLLASTPGYCCRPGSTESWEFFADKDGVVNYGLELKQGPFPPYCRLDGQDSTPESILDRIGPAMAPIKVDVDHKVDMPHLDLTPLTIALAGGAVLLFSALAQKKD